MDNPRQKASPFLRTDLSRSGIYCLHHCVFEHNQGTCSDLRIQFHQSEQRQVSVYQESQENPYNDREIWVVVNEGLNQFPLGQQILGSLFIGLLDKHDGSLSGFFQTDAIAPPNKMIRIQKPFISITNSPARKESYTGAIISGTLALLFLAIALGQSNEIQALIWKYVYPRLQGAITRRPGNIILRGNQDVRLNLMASDTNLGQEQRLNNQLLSIREQPNTYFWIFLALSFISTVLTIYFIVEYEKIES